MQTLEVAKILGLNIYNHYSSFKLSRLWKLLIQVSHFRVDIYSEYKITNCNKKSAVANVGILYGVYGNLRGTLPFYVTKVNNLSYDANHVLPVLLLTYVNYEWRFARNQLIQDITFT